MQLAPVAAAPPPAAVAAAAPTICTASSTVPAATTDGLLRLLPLDDTPPRTLAIQVQQGGQPHPLAQPCAALCSLPGSGGLLLAQRGSGRLLFCPPLDPLDGGSGCTDLFLFGMHDVPVTAIVASPCGSFSLTGDVQGSVKLWNLADGALLGAAPAAEGGAAVAAACFLSGGAAATAPAGSSTVQVWSTQGGSLSLVGELDAAGGGSSCTVTALAAAGPFLALGCSDGSTQVWRYSRGELEQHARVSAPCGNPAPVRCLALSADSSAPLLAVAAGPSVAILHVAGELLAARQLAAAPMALYWSSSGELHALLADGCQLQRLGAPKQADAPAAAAAGEASPRKKAVRFADQQGVSPAAGTAEQAGGPSQRHASSMPAALPTTAPPPGLSLPSLSGRTALPPLPLHPRLQGSSFGSSLAGLPSSCVPRNWPSSSGSESSSGRVPSSPLSSRCPAYPVLDLRVLQGLRPAAVRGAGITAAEGTGGTAMQAGGDRQSASAGLGAGGGSKRPSPQRPIPAPATASTAGISSTHGTRQTGAALSAAATEPDGRQQPAEDSCSRQAAAQAPSIPLVEDEMPRPRPLPPPLQLSDQPPRTLTAEALGSSEQQCDACMALAAAPALSSRPASPAKAVMLAQVAQLGSKAAASAERAQAVEGNTGSSSTVSPVKQGVLCTRQVQQPGELLPAEVLPFTVVEHETSLAHSEFRQQRYARISRRCAAGQQQAAGAVPPAGEGHGSVAQQAAASTAPVEGPSETEALEGLVQCRQEPDEEAVGQAATIDGAQATVPASAVSAGQAVVDAEACPCAAAAVQAPCAADASSTACTAAEAAPPVPAVAAIPLPARGTAVCEVRSPPLQAADGAATPGPAWEQLQVHSFAVASDAELSDSDDEAGESGAAASSHGSLPDAAAVWPRHATPQQPLSTASAVQQANGSSSSSSSLAEIRSALQQLQLVCRFGSAPAGACQQQTARPASCASAPPLPLVSPAPDPASALAAPAPNSSLLAAQRRQELELQAASRATAPLVGEQQAEMLRKAATAAATLPPGARLYSALPPPAVPATNDWSVSAQRAAALAGATKQVDPSWASERQELRPALQDLWTQRVPELNRLQTLPAALEVPLPEPSQLAFQFLGLLTD